METMNIALSPEMKEYVQAEVSRGGFSSTSEYIRALIRDDQKKKEELRLEALLLEGIQSGKASAFSPEDWQKINSRVQNRIRSRQQEK